MQVCGEEALTYKRTEVPREQATQEVTGEIEASLQALMKQHGMEAVIHHLKEMANKDR